MLHLSAFIVLMMMMVSIQLCPVLWILGPGLSMSSGLALHIYGFRELLG